MSCPGDPASNVSQLTRERGHRLASFDQRVQQRGHIERIEVRPGDYVVADEDGIAVAPKERYPEVVVAAKEWQSDKQALLPLIEKYGSYLKALQERDAEKRKR